MYHTDTQTWLFIHQATNTELQADAATRSLLRRRRGRVESVLSRNQRSNEVLIPAPNA